MVETPSEEVSKPAMNKMNNPQPETSKKNIHVYCILCRKNYLKHEAQEHMHSMLHHRELETALGKNSFHNCQACRASSMGLNEYAQHISTAQHKDKLKNLMSKNVKPFSLYKTLNQETVNRILERNKTLKKQEKKTMKKRKKKLKQVAGQKKANVQSRITRKTMVSSKIVNPQQSKKVDVRTLTQMQETHQKSQNRRTEPKGRTWHHPYPEPQLRYEHFSVNNQYSRIKRPQTNTQGGGANTPEQLSWSAINDQYDSDFTSDNLPVNGAIIFSPGQDERPSTSQPRPAIRDVDVTAMLRQIRRALGVREPCRADREARKQSSEAGARATDHCSTQQVGTRKEQTRAGSFRSYNNKAADACLQSPQANTSAAAKQTTSKTIQETPPHWERSTVVVCDSNGPSNSSDTYRYQGASAIPTLDSLTPLRRCQTTSTESSPNINSKARIAHKPSKVQGDKEDGDKPLLQKLFALSGGIGKINWRELRGKKQEKRNDMPRFGTEQVNSFSHRDSSVQTEDKDMPLSEGFHWESLPLPDVPASTQHIPPQNTTDNGSHIETQSRSRLQEAVGLASLTLESSSQTEAAPVSVKVEVEANLEDENRDLRNDSSANKRKHKTNDGISDVEPSGKKKKTKSNKDQGQMDQLLAVSLREEELSQSLYDLDKSLVQARNALQAAYTEVQRLLLLRQQFTSEVNSLRAKRIEILQGMQEGYSGGSNAVEKASTSSALLAADTSSHLPPATNPASSISQGTPTSLSLPSISIKQEICQPPSAEQPTHLAQTVLCNTNGPQVALFPPDLLLLPPPHLAASTTAASFSKQLKPGCSKLVNTSQAREVILPVESHHEEEEEKAGNISNGQGKGTELTAEKSALAPPKGKNTSAAAANDDNGGNEGNNTVEIMEPSNLVVIGIDISDKEYSPEADSHDPVQQEPPQKSDGEELSSASAHTSQDQDVERKCQPVKEANIQPEAVQPVEDEEPFSGVFVNHTGPVHGLQVHGGFLYTCSGDNTARAYSLVNGECQAVFEGHTNKVNCLLVLSLPNMTERLYTGSSDQTICCFSIKSKKCLEQIALPDRVLCLHIAWNILYAGLANGSVASYDLKTLKQLDVFECHGPRGISCLGTSQEGARRVLLVGSYDSTISVRDAKSCLLLRTLRGHSKTVLCMKVVNDLVFSGSSDASVHAHNIHTGELVRIYKGHGHAVTSIVILGNVMVTACLDKLVRVYELQSHDRLQVYGGHSDMVMCMAVHKSVIYTGCYDGSVKAVKLNLMKNFRCWWQNCSLIFGMAEHLQQHLTGDHSNPNLQTVKCRWKGCSAFFSTQQQVRQELPKHMESHVEKDSKVQP